MKLAGSSASFDGAIAAGGLTQLEWLDLCARDLALDGVVFDARHFPRTDADYLAQLRKMATDLGLTVAALSCDSLLGDAAEVEPSAERWLRVASALGAPLALARTPQEATRDPSAWSALVSAGKSAASAAKRLNVTIGVRNAGGTLCASGADLRRLAKDVDSSWVRFALDVAALDPPEPLGAALPKTVAATHDSRSLDPLGADEADLGGVLRALGDFRGFLVIDFVGAVVEGTSLARLFHWARSMLAKETLAREGG
jgi:hypothetical protein